MAAATTAGSAQHFVENFVKGKGVTNTALASVPAKRIEGHLTGTVAVPSIGTAGLGGSVAVTVTGAALGDVVLAGPKSALPTNCVMTNAYVSAADTVTLAFQAVGGTVTGANNTFNIVFIDLT